MRWVEISENALQSADPYDEAFTWFRVSYHECFIFEFVTIDALSTGAIASSEVPSLAHEPWDDTVKATSSVSKAMLARAQGTEVF